MSKRHVTLSVENELLEEAKEKGLIISEILKKALKEKLEKKEITVETNIKKCEICGIEYEMAKKENGFIGICWFCPDNLWACHNCRKMENIKRISLTG